MIDLLAIYFPLLLCFLFVSTFIGRFFLKQLSVELNKNRFEEIFFSLLSGTILLSFFTGIIVSSGISMQWMIAVVALFLLFEKYKSGSLPKLKFNKSLNFPLPPLFHLSLGIILIFLWQTITHYESINDPSIVPYKDLIFYSDVSQFMMQNGNENQFQFANDWFESLNGITAYHYFELWINGMVGSITGNYLYSIIFITNAWFLILTWLGLSALSSRLRKNDDSNNLLIGLAGLWLIGLSGGLFSETGMWRYSDAIINSPSIIIFQKTAVVYPFFIAAILLWWKGKLMESRLVLLFLPVVSVATAPAILIAIGMLSIHDLFFRKNYSHFFRTISYLGIFTFFYFLLLNYFGTPIGISGLDSDSMGVIFEKSYIAVIIYFIQTIPIIHLFAALPWIALLLFIHSGKWNLMKEKSQLKKFAALLSFWISSFLSWQIFNYQGADAIQFFSVIAGVILNLGFFLIFVKATDSNLLSKIMALSFLAGGICYSYLHNEKNNHFIQYDKQYVSDVLNANSEMNNPNKAFILSANEYKESSDYHPYFKKAAWFLANDPQIDVMVNIGRDHLSDFKEWDLYKLNQWETSAFNLFEKKFKKYLLKEINGSSQLAFIDKYEIKMLFLGKNVMIPLWIQSKIEKFYSDPISGERCLILEDSPNKK